MVMLWVAFVIIHLVTGGVFSVLWHCLPRLSLPFLGRVSQSLTHGSPILKLFSFPLSLLPSECVYRSMWPCGTRRQPQVYFLRLSLHSFFQFFASLELAEGSSGLCLVSAEIARTYHNAQLACFLHLFNYLFIYCRILGLNSGLHASKAGTVSTKPSLPTPKRTSNTVWNIDSQSSSGTWWLTGDISVSTLTSSLGDKVTNWSNYHIGSTLYRKPLSPGTADPHMAVPYAQETLQHSPQQYETWTQTTFAHKCLWALEVTWSQSDTEWEVSTDMISVRLLWGLRVGGSHTILLLSFFLLKFLCKFSLTLPSYSTISSARPCPGFPW